MKNKNELSYKDLKITCNPNIFQFETSENINLGKNGKGWIFIDKEELKTGFVQNAKFEWENS